MKYLRSTPYRKNNWNLEIIKDKQIEERYEMEYNPTDWIVPYQYFTPLMGSVDTFKLITGDNPTEYWVFKILEMWSWSWAFLDRLTEEWVPKNNIYVIEPAWSAIESIQARWFKNAYKWYSTMTLEDKFDRIFMSYFIDRDPNQKWSFDSAIDKLSPQWWKIIFEGLLPCHPYDSRWMCYGEEENMITKWKSISDDTNLIIEYMKNKSLEKWYRISDIIVSQWYRFVSSAKDWPEILPSTYITFNLLNSSI